MIETAVFAMGIVASGVRLSIPILFAALGEQIAERSGVLNLGVEGMMLMGAFTGFIGTYLTGNIFIGLALAMSWPCINGRFDGFYECQPTNQSTRSGTGYLAFGRWTYITFIQIDIRSSNNSSQDKGDTSN